MTLVNQWTDASALPATFSTPRSTIATRQVTIGSAAGNWLIVSVSWHTGAGAQTTPTVHVADDAHNFWVPLVRASGAGGGVAIWAAPNARAAARIYVAPTDYVTGLSIHVAEHSGLGNYLQVADRKTATAAGTSASLTLAAPPAQALALVAGGSDDATATLTSATAGWTSATAVSGTNGSDATSDTRLLPRYQTTTGSVSVTYTTSSTANIAAVGVTVLTAAAAPAQPRPNWPTMAFEVGFGSGAQTPRDQISWTTLAGRLLGLDCSRGRNYQLGTVEAADIDLRLRNDDAALNPANTGSPYYPNVVDMTPFRVTATWAGRVYGVCAGFLDSLPQSWRDPHWGEVNASAYDVWGTLSAELPDVVEGEILLDAPYGYWPMSDPDEATVGSNLAPNNSEPFRQVTSKYGPGSAHAAFGVDQGMLVGAPGNTSWEQRGLTSLQTANGISLQCGPGPVFPPVAPGWTVEFWARLDVSASQPASNLTLFSVKNGSGTLMSVYVDQASQCVTIADYDPTTHVRTNTVSAKAVLDGAYHHHCLTFDTTGWRLYVDAQLTIQRTTPLDSTVTWLTACGAADETFHGRMINGSFAHFAVFPRRLPYGRVVAHYWAGAQGNLNDATDWRINKLLAMGGYGVPRALSYTGSPGTDLVPATDIEGQPVSASVEVVAASDGGGLFVDSHDDLCFTSKVYRYNRPPQYVFGDRPDLGETPYLGDVVFERDPAQVTNMVTVTQAYYGRTVTASDTASIRQRGKRPLARTTYLIDALQVADTANYLLLKNRVPGLRVSTITIDPAANPALWPIALGVETGDVVTVNRRPVGGVLLTGLFEVIRVAHHVEPEQGVWRTTFNLAPADPPFFVLDDPVYGVLDGPGVLGW
ncbi:LamG-like jellyroll fold domain-containing protein [Streptosporangium sp. NPDC051022]|uniref:LamG-like jellyroll fold domain-containing protein n=1 Tax=Streptosporangium sp. NPDC051022 TaxID=3155752 RepID=UPI00343BD8F1